MRCSNLSACLFYYLLEFCRVIYLILLQIMKAYLQVQWSREHQGCWGKCATQSQTPSVLVVIFYSSPSAAWKLSCPGDRRR